MARQEGVEPCSRVRSQRLLTGASGRHLRRLAPKVSERQRRSRLTNCGYIKLLLETKIEMARPEGFEPCERGRAPKALSCDASGSGRGEPCEPRRRTGRGASL